MTLLRNILAIVLGIVVGSAVNMALVALSPAVIPPPEGVSLSDPQSLNASIHLLEPRHYLFPFLAHALGTFAGASVAYLVAATRRPIFAYVIGIFFLAGGVAAVAMIRAPLWFIVLDLVVAYLPMGWLATLLGRRLAARS
jgi:hypothetical protein